MKSGKAHPESALEALGRLRSAGRCLAIVATAVMAWGCGDSGSGDAARTSTATTPTRGGTIVRHLESDCKTLNYVLFNTTSENYVLRYLYDALIDYDENGRLRPVLAESYDVSRDKMEITVVLRDSVRWHDGKPVTAEDVAFTVDKIRDPAIPAVNKAGWFKSLDRVEVIDERTLRFVWSEPYAPGLHALTQIAPIPQHIYAGGDFVSHPANRAPVGNGAFKFVEWNTAESIILERNDDYYAGAPYVDRIIFRVIPDRAVALSALKTGEIDEMRVRQEQWDRQTNDEGFLNHYERIHYYVPSYNYIAWNCRAVYFKDTRVRRAMTLLYDRQSIIDNIYSGYSKAISGPFYVNSAAYDQTIAPHPYDPKEGERLLDEAGWRDSDGDGIRDKDGVEFRFEFNYISGSEISRQFAVLMQEGLNRAGIEMDIRPIEGATFFDQVFNGDYVAALLAWRLDPDPDLYDTFHSSQVPPIGLNHAFYSNPEIDELLERGRREFDYDTRMAIYREVHRAIHEDSPYTFINAVPEKRPVSKRIGNVVLSPDGPFNYYPGAIYWYVKDQVVGANN